MVTTIPGVIGVRLRSTSRVSHHTTARVAAAPSGQRKCHSSPGICQRFGNWALRLPKTRVWSA